MKKDTLIAHAGLNPQKQQGAVNPPVHRASTIVFPTMEDLRASNKRRFETLRYGLNGTPTSYAFEEAVAALEGADRCMATCSGLAAVTGALLAFLKSGDHLLMVDSVYWPTRDFCNDVLAGYGIETTYYDPLIGAGIEDLIRPNTKVVFVESPGSLTFEVQDVPAIAEAAHRHGAVVVMDNTWASPLHFQPFEHGVDVSIQAATKYIAGHSDAMLGTISTTEQHWHRLKTTVTNFGFCAGSEEVWLGLRGLRTIKVRMRQHEENAMRVAAWLQGHDDILRVLYPALPDDPGHEIWKRDFTGANGLMGIELRPCSQAAVDAFVDNLKYFALGFSWGGFESLVLPSNIKRATAPFPTQGPIVRLHIGLEDPDDLIADLAQALESMKAAG